MALSVKELKLRVRDLDVCYVDTAAQAAGLPPDREILVLLHGWGASKEAFAPVIESLKERYRIVAPDLPGFGKSDEPRRPWDAGDYRDFFKAFLQETGLADRQINCAGHSNGGRILIKWAADRPGCLKRLILIDSAGIPPRHGPLWYLKVYSYKAAKRLAALPGLRIALGPLLQACQARAGSADYRQASPLMKQTMTALLQEDLQPLMPQIQAPTLLIWGQEDRATPLEDGQRMHELIPGSGLAVFKPAGHYAYLDRLPQFLRTLIYFLEH